jgi:hypothetical protein
MSSKSSSPGISLFKTLLMPISQAIFWYLLLFASPTTSTTQQDVYTTIFRSAFFYGAWALANKYGGNKRERAYYTMGLAVVASYLEQRYLTIAACTLVFLNYAVPAFLLFPMTTKALAKVTGKGDGESEPSTAVKVWAVIFKLYFLSSMAFWISATYKLAQLD